MAIFLDFKGAFETIDGEIHIPKSDIYGIKEYELEWFRSYITDRKQMTKVDGTNSVELNTEFGVPKGSILEALLLTIFINDVPNM